MRKTPATCWLAPWAGLLLGTSQAAWTSTPAPRVDATVQVAGHPMHYQLYGKGTPLLLLHGGGNTISGSFANQIAYFAPKRLLIAPEQIGQGRTPDVQGDWSYAAMAEQTVALLDYLKIPRADIIGYSDGGIVGLLIASRYPQRVRHLVVTGANTAAGNQALTPEVIASDTIYDPDKDLVGRLFYEQTTADPPEHFAVFARKLHKLWDTQPLPGDLPAEQLAKIRAPTIVMAGDHDVVRREHTQAIARSIPGATLMIVPNTGHDTLQSRAATLDPLIERFIDGAL